MATPNMNLLSSTPLVTLGPAWAQNIEDSILLIDSHDHSSGKGVPVKPAGLLINADLPFGGFFATNLKGSKYTPESGSLGSSEQNVIYVVNGNLYYNNGSGTAVQITSGASVNVSGVGGISGMTGTTAAVTYSDVTKTFAFTQDAGIVAHLDAGKVSVREAVGGGHAITLQAPGGLAGSYSLTFPTALPASTLPLLISAAGVLSSTQLTSAHIGDLQVTGAKIANSTINREKIVPRRGDSGSSGGFNTISSSYVTVVGASVTTTGGPVLIKLISASGASPSQIRVVGSSVVATFRISRGGNVIKEWEYPATSTGILAFIPTFVFEETPSAATHSYVLEAKNTSGGLREVWVENMKLVVEELLT